MQTLSATCRVHPDGDQASELSRLTAELLDAEHAIAISEHARFLSVKERGLQLDHEALEGQLRGRTVLVTGGTGCIGSKLLGEISRYAPGRLVSLSRGELPAENTACGAEYRFADLRDRDAVRRVLDEVRPDIVYHLAAQHDPGLAELEPARTVMTNVFGTRNLVEAATAVGTELIVYASTGKALRPFTPDIYAASKKAGEWILAEAAGQGGPVVAGVRFTHVVDNSIIFDRLQSWIETGTTIRLHAPEILFYLQSALESAHLLLDAGLQARPGELRMQAIRSLDDPVGLTHLALGALAARDRIVPIHFCGFDAGYEELPFPTLYDPLWSGDVSPLINAMEAPDAGPSTTCPEVDGFTVRVAPSCTLATAAKALESACRCGSDDATLKDLSAVLCWALLDARLDATETPVLERAAARAAKDPSPANQSPMHARTNEAIIRAAGRRR